MSIGAEAVILVGGNHTHRTDWFSLYPFPEVILDAYKGKGDTHIMDGAWIGMRAMIMPGVTIGEGAIVTKDVAPYTIVAGNPAVSVRQHLQPRLRNLCWRRTCITGHRPSSMHCGRFSARRTWRP